MACPIRPDAPISAIFNVRSAVTAPPGPREEALHAFKEAALARCVPIAAAAKGSLELANQLALLGGQIHGCLDDDATEEVAARATAYRPEHLCPAGGKPARTASRPES